MTLSAEALRRSLVSSVKALIEDLPGRIAIEDLLADLTFGADALEAILAAPTELDPWRVGEALAACVAAEHEICIFPWPPSRDARTPRASLPGADLAGFRQVGDEHQFAFGEIKTSSERTSPPSVVSHSRDGLTAQLLRLRDEKGHREALFRYLAHRARGQAWEAAFRSAASRFLGDDNDVFLVGLIVRDTPPEQADLASSARRLAKDCPASTCVHLAAVYLPPDTISGLEQMYLDANAEAA